VATATPIDFPGTSGSSAIMILLRFGVTLFRIRKRSFSDIISGILVKITDLIIALGIVFIMQFLIREFEKVFYTLTASSVVKVTSASTLTFSWMEIVWSLIMGS